MSLLAAVLLVSTFAIGALPRAAASTSNGFEFTALLGPTDADAVGYTATPSLPVAYTIQGSQVGYLTSDGEGAWGTANGTSDYVGDCVFSSGCGGAGFAGSQTVEPYTGNLTSLNNNNVQCYNEPFDTTFVFAAAILDMPSGASVGVDMEVDDGGEVYIAPVASLAWDNLFDGNAWVGQALTDYNTHVSLAAGDYLVVLESFNWCAEGGFAVQFADLPGGATFTPSLFGLPQPKASTGLSPCESGGSCYSTAVVVDAHSGGATVTISSTGGATYTAVTSTAASTSGICSMPVNGTLYGCSLGETGQFILSSGVTYAYTIAFSDGKQAIGSFDVTSAWTVQVVSVPAE